MVNPQLGGIKELPPLPDTFEPNQSNTELQTAISSITEAGGIVNSSPTLIKRKQGRPLGSKNKKIKSDAAGYKITKDFQDDPELSNELEKFAISFDCFKQICRSSLLFKKRIYDKIVFNSDLLKHKNTKNTNLENKNLLHNRIRSNKNKIKTKNTGTRKGKQ